ncbi:hypothetical protein TH53_01175 [Pedobacter lusitanus]|uniref:Contig6, whole genome shotgun sequence n=1 Tax=Pedobacter lusitanus TaxID=1503925 RepID=A0A0D0GWD0_9SPHI|nr:hypothetical protein [Pedobacter lusitanus]KIO78741.1 hypothetical protein TH53_01175 [Pedobacter lusitanus]
MKTKKILLLKRSVIAFTTVSIFFTACKKDQNPSPAPVQTNLAAKGKQVAGMIVKDSSVILNTQAIGLLTQVNAKELVFKSKPAQADSMGTHFIIASGIIPEKAPLGLLLRSTGNYEDAQGFHVQIEEAQLKDYIVSADIRGEIELDPEHPARMYSSTRDKKQAQALPNTSAFTLPDLIPHIKGSETITGKDIDLTQTFPVYQDNVSKATVKIHFLATPKIQYWFRVDPVNGVQLEVNSNLNVKELKATFEGTAGFKFLQIAGDNVYIPLVAIPVGPIVITPYISLFPYLEGTVAGTASFSINSTENISFGAYKKGIANFGGSAELTATVFAPAAEKLEVPLTLEVGIQATVGVGIYGKTVFAQVQAKAGPKLVTTTDILNTQTRFNLTVPAKVTAAVGSGLPGFSFPTYGATLFEKNLYEKQWVYDWPKLAGLQGIN